MERGSMKYAIQNTTGTNFAGMRNSNQYGAGAGNSITPSNTNVPHNHLIPN